MTYLVDAAIHPEWGVDEAVADLLVAITLKNISIKSLNSLCGLFKESVQNKATANAGNKLILCWIDKTRTKKWVINVQEQVLNLLFTMLVNKSSESEDDTTKVLEYFKNQFVNIRGHATPVTDAYGYSTTGGGAMSEKETTARQCILTCAIDCLTEIKRSAHALSGGGVNLPSGVGGAGTSPVAARSMSSRRGSRGSPSRAGSLLQRGASSLSEAGGESAQQDDDPADLRSRAAQAASLLAIVLELVENLRPEVLAALHGDAPGAAQHMCGVLLQEALDAAAYDDVSPKDWLARLELLGALSAHLVSIEQQQQIHHHQGHGANHFSVDGGSAAVLTPEAVDRLWQCGAVDHARLGPVLLRWLSVVLKPKELKRDADYFGSLSDAAESRAMVLEKLGERLVAASSSLSSSSSSSSLSSPSSSAEAQDEGLGGHDGVACFLNLFLWVNKDTGCFDDDDADDEMVDTSSAGLPALEGGSSLFPDSDDDDEADDDNAATSTSTAPILVKGDSIASFEALVAAALDPPDVSVSSSSSSSPAAAASAAARCLLRVGQGLFVATQERHASLFRMQEAATGGLGRYDLLAALQARILADASASASGADGGGASASGQAQDNSSNRNARRLNHRLQVLAHFLHATASANKQAAHGARAAANGDIIKVTVTLEGSGSSGSSTATANNKNVALAAGVAAAAGGVGTAQGGGGSLERASVTLHLHGNTTLQGATAAAVEALVAASDPLSSTGAESPTAAGAGSGAGSVGVMPGSFVWKLKPTPPPPPAYTVARAAGPLKSLPPFKVRGRERVCNFFG